MWLQWLPQLRACSFRVIRQRARVPLWLLRPAHTRPRFRAADGSITAGHDHIQPMPIFIERRHKSSALNGAVWGNDGRQRNQVVILDTRPPQGSIEGCNGGRPFCGAGGDDNLHRLGSLMYLFRLHRHQAVVHLCQ